MFIERTVDEDVVGRGLGLGGQGYFFFLLRLLTAELASRIETEPAFVAGFKIHRPVTALRPATFALCLVRLTTSV